MHTCVPLFIFYDISTYPFTPTHITIYRYTDTSVSLLRFSKPEQNHLEEESSNLSLLSGTSCNMPFPLGRYPKILSRIAGEARKAESYLYLMILLRLLIMTVPIYFPLPAVIPPTKAENK